MSEHSKLLRTGFILIFMIIVIGCIGYMLIENLSVIDAFYMTVITISTTGFREVHPLSKSGKLFTVFLIFGGVSSIAYTGGRAVQILIESEIFRRRKMSKTINSLSGHYIICGYGRMGKQICEGLRYNNLEFIVIENDTQKIDQLIEKKYLFLNGDATSDEVLIKAGVKKAKGLVSAIDTDAQNVFTTLSAKQLNPGLYVVTRAVDEGTESKLKKAGADRVVKPYELGGNRMVQLLLRPGVIDFIESIARHKGVEIVLEELKVCANSSLVGQSLLDSPIRKKLNVIIVAIHRHNGSLIYNPTSETVIEKNDRLIVIGDQKRLFELNKLCNIG